MHKACVCSTQLYDFPYKNKMASKFMDPTFIIIVTLKPDRMFKHFLSFLVI